MPRFIQICLPYIRPSIGLNKYLQTRAGINMYNVCRLTVETIAVCLKQMMLDS